MKKFSITRISTKTGTFRLSGQLIILPNDIEIDYESAEFMNTDGWCTLDLGSAQTKKLLTTLQQEVLDHLA